MVALARPVLAPALALLRKQLRSCSKKKLPYMFRYMAVFLYKEMGTSINQKRDIYRLDGGDFS